MSTKKIQDSNHLLELVERSAGRRVALLGDLLADEFIYGDITRVSREAPVLVLEHRRTAVVPGGGGNSLANLKALGARPVPIGVVGRDTTGDKLLDVFKSMGCPLSGIIRLAGYATPAKSRVLAGGLHTRRQQIVRIDRGAQHGNLPPHIQQRLERNLERALERCEGLLIADYGYGAASPAVLRRLLPRLARKQFVVTVDSRSRITRYRGITACTPNEEELEQALGGITASDARAFSAAGRHLLQEVRADAVLVTRGPKGMCLFRKGRSMISIPAHGSGEVADVTGAGDTVIAAFTLALVSGAKLVDAARIANYAAGMVVRKAGTATITSAELRKTISEEVSS